MLERADSISGAFRAPTGVHSIDGALCADPHTAVASAAEGSTRVGETDRTQAGPAAEVDAQLDAPLDAAIRAQIEAELAADFEANVERELAGCLAGLLAEAPPGGVLAAAVEDAADSSAGGFIADLSDDALVSLYAAGLRLATWATARSVRAVAELARRWQTSADGWGDPDGPLDPTTWRGDLGHRAAAQEAALAASCSLYAAEVHLDAGLHLPQLLPMVAAAFEAGELDWAKVREIWSRTRCLRPEHAAAVEAAVLPGALTATLPHLRQSLIETILATDPAGADAAAADAHDRRAVRARANPDGSATLALTAGSADIAAADAALTALAQVARASGARHPGDTRTDGTGTDDTGGDNTGPGTNGAEPVGSAGDSRDHLTTKADVLLDLIHEAARTHLGPSVDDADAAEPEDPADSGSAAPGSPDNDGSAAVARPGSTDSGPASPTNTGSAGSAGSAGSTEPAGTAAIGSAGVGEPGTSCPACGRPSGSDPCGSDGQLDRRRRDRGGRDRGGQDRGGRVEVIVTVPLSTILRLSDTPGYLNGYGPIPPGLARELAEQVARTSLDGHWRCAVTDDRPHTVHGTLLALGRSTFSPRYVPPRTTVRYVTTRDGTCVFPGCRRHAGTADLDHRLPYGRGGVSCECNMQSLCANHHRLKHHPRGFRVATVAPHHPAAAVGAVPALTWTSPTGRTYLRDQHQLPHAPVPWPDDDPPPF